MEKNAEDYAYSHIAKSVPTTQTISRPVDENDEPGESVIEYGDKKNLFRDWNAFNMDLVQKNATLTWGEKDSWTVTQDKQIVHLSVARGELTHAGRLNAAGQRLFMRRKKISWFGHHCLGVLTTGTRDTILIYKEDFAWYDSESGDIVRDGITFAMLILSKVRPDVLIKAFEELQKMKLIKPVDFKYDIVDWLGAMEKRRLGVSLKLKISTTSMHLLRTSSRQPKKFHVSYFARTLRPWNRIGISAI